MKVIIIGSGNVATVLGKKIGAAGHEILQVISRSKEHAKNLATKLNAASSDSLNELSRDADIYLICVGDSNIATVANQLSIDNKIVVHTAGAVSKSVLNAFQSYGVLYPLQSLRKEMEHMPVIPVMVDGNSPETSNVLSDFASGWASSVLFATDEERLIFHVAAVISSNFSNHLYALANDFCSKEGVSFSHLLPLIQETAARLNQTSPSNLQTGPATRNDTLTINKHLEILNTYPELKKLYSSMTESIRQHSAGFK